MGLTSQLSAQSSDGRPAGQAEGLADSIEVVFTSEPDSLEWERNRALALRGTELRVLVSLRERQVIVMRGGDTVRTAPAAVASGKTIRYAGRSWTFRTPVGRHSVLRKIRDPV